MRRPKTALAVLAAVLLPVRIAAASSIWVVDDGEKIKQGDVPATLAAGKDNAIWSPGQPIRLFAMKNETVSFQVVVFAEPTALSDVTVDLDALEANGGQKIANAPGAKDPTKYV